MKIYKLLLLFSFISFLSADCSSQTSKIVGTWTVFFKDEKVSSLTCNVCPKWEFKSDNTLVFTKPDNETEYSTWEIDDDNMLSFGKTITGPKGVTENKMSNSKLKVLFSKSGSFEEMRFDYNGKIAPMVLRK